MPNPAKALNLKTFPAESDTAVLGVTTRKSRQRPVPASRPRRSVRFLVRQSARPHLSRSHELWRTPSRCPQDPGFPDLSCCRTLRALSCPDPRYVRRAKLSKGE